MRRAPVLLVAALLTAAGPAAAAGDCFCLVHAATGAVLRGCSAYKAPTDRFQTAVCTDPATGATSEQTIAHDWQRIEDGADRCDPCRPAPRDTAPEVPREGGELPAGRRP